MNQAGYGMRRWVALVAVCAFFIGCSEPKGGDKEKPTAKPGDRPGAAAPSISAATNGTAATNGVTAPFIYRQKLEPTADMLKEAFIVGKLSEENHFARRTINEEVGRETVKNFMKSLDPWQLIFLQSDVDGFVAQAGRVRQGLTRQDLSLPVEIFEVFQDRIQQRSAQVKELLKDKHDFTVDENIVLDRTKLGWPKDETEARDLWRRYVKFQLLQEKLNKEPMDKAVEIVSKRIDRQLRAINEIDAGELVSIYLNALAKNYDPHTEYQSQDGYNEFKISMKLSLFGIGATLTTEDGLTKIVSLAPGGPAEKDARLKPGDKIIAVAQGDEEYVDCIDMKLKKVVSMIRGPKGTKVRLKIIPANAVDPAQRSEITLVRDEIKLVEQEAKARLVEWTDAKGKVRKLGVLDLPMFYSDPDEKENGKSLTTDTAKLIESLKKQGVEAIIVDLRRNGGGDLKEAIKLTGLFIPVGPVVQVKDAQGNVEVFRDTDSRVVYDGPLVVLTSHGSASASEIFAAALQDYGRALVVGESSTFGKGTVQALIELRRFYNTEQSGAYKMTIQKFYRIAGGSTQLKGVIPDVQLPSIFDVLDIAERSLERPLPYDEISPVEFARDGRVSPAMASRLNKAKDARIRDNTDFKYILEDIEVQKSRPKDRPISLNEKARLAEKEADKRRLEARKKERSERKPSAYKIQQITLSKPEPHPVPEKKKPVSEKPKDEEEDLFELPENHDPALEETFRIMEDMLRTESADQA